MMSQAKTDLLNALQELSALGPDMRLGQWIANLAPSALGATAEAIWDVEDEELLAAAQQPLGYFRATRQESPISPTRRELMQVIRELSACCDWRLGQLIANLATAARLPYVRHGFPEAVYDAEDEEMLPAARNLLEYFRTTRPERFAEHMAVASTG